MTWLRGSAVLLAVIGWTSLADAQAAPSTAEADADLRMGPHIGGYVSDQADGILLGFSGLWRYQFVQGGALFEYGGQVFGDNMIAAALTGGLCWIPTNDVRVDMLGVLGARHYMAVGARFLSDDPGASATLGYAGALWGVSYVFGRSTRTTRPFRALLGARAGLDTDLTQVTDDYSYVESAGLFGPDEPTTVMRHRVLGATRVLITLHYGVVFDL